jgi:hypothetical protein
MNSRAFFLCVVSVLICGQGRAQTANSDSICEPSGYLVGYFNGVGSTLRNNTDSINSIKKRFGETKNNQKISYQLFINPTDGYLGDVAEAFKQKLDANPADTTLTWKLFWKALHAKLKIDNPSTLKDIIYNQTIDSALDKRKAAFDALVQQANYLPVVKAQVDTLRPFLLQGSKAVLVAHSQGNLFVVDVVKTLKREFGESSMAVAHVAPAGDTLLGDYVLTNADIVIEGVRVTSGHVPPANSIDNVDQVHRVDRSGHFFKETYFNAALPAIFAKTTGIIEQAFLNVQPPGTGVQTAVNQGFFTTTLTWTGAGDVDLHTTEPDGTHVYYGARAGHSGALDLDNTVAFGPEHYYATCFNSQLQVGTYNVAIDNFSNTSGLSATVTLTSGTKSFKSTTVAVGPKSAGAYQHVFSVVVTKDAQGKPTAKLQQ